MDPSVQPVVQTCYRHPDSPAGVICQRCDRPICPKCMNQASVGFHCPECVRSGKQKVVTGPGVFLVKPILTQILIAVNVLVFLLVVGRDGAEVFGGEMGRSMVDFGLVAKGFVRTTAGIEAVGVGEGEWYRMITAGFMHYGIIHLALNCFALWTLGQAVEQFGGRLRMGIIYGIALLAGSFGALLVSPGKLTAGASGAIFGLMGALFVAFRTRGIPFQNSPLLPTLLINLVITFGLPNISAGGHIGGLLGGGLTAWLLFDLGPQKRLDKGVLYGLCAGLAVALFVGGLVVAGGYTPT